MHPYLPPLPPVPGVDEDEYRPSGRSIIAVLSEEHLQIARLSSELVEQSDSDDGRDLASVITAMVSRHLSAEEQYLYPAVRALLPNGAKLADHEISHDESMLRRLAVLEAMRPNSRSFHAVVGELEEDLNQHMRTITMEIFPKLREVASEEDLIRLGNRIEVAEEAAPTRPHLNTPSRPPWNKVVDPLIGTADKVMDVFSGRKTFPDELD